MEAFLFPKYNVILLEVDNILIKYFILFKYKCTYVVYLILVLLFYYIDPRDFLSELRKDSRRSCNIRQYISSPLTRYKAEQSFLASWKIFSLVHNRPRITLET